MVSGAPKRVLCLTCNKQHNYRAPKGEGASSRSAGGGSGLSASGSSRSSSTKKASAAAAPKAMTAAREWQATVGDRESGDFLPYSIHRTFEVGQLVQHPKFGSGYVKETLNAQKLCILFKDGPRTLIHGRS
jgi:hypothetical protein